MSSISTRRKHRKIKCLQSFKSSQLNAQRSNLNNFCIVEFHSIHSIIYIIEVLKHMWWLSIEQQMQQLRSQNLRFDDCRIAHSIDKKSFDKVHMLNLSSLIAKSNFFKKLLERSLLFYIILFFENVSRDLCFDEDSNIKIKILLSRIFFILSILVSIMKY